jgi:apolipoprotein N-acyltransferase
MTNKTELIKSKNHFFIASVISGILIGTSYIPYPAWAVLFCYIPLWWSAFHAEKQKKSLKFIFTLGWISQFLLTLIGFHWLYYTATVFGHLPTFIAGLTVLAYASLVHIYIPISLVCAIWLRRRLNLSEFKLILLFAIILLLLERLWPSIFEWNLGYTLLWMKWPLFQWADTIGFWGLSSVILFAQSIILYLGTQLKTDTKKAVWGGLLLCVTLVILNFTGEIKQKKWSKTDNVFNITVAQGNISNEEKLASEKGAAFQPYVLKVYTDLVDQHLPTLNYKPDAILWPETALPFALDSTFENRSNQIQLQNHINQWNIVLLTGGYSVDIYHRDHLGNFKTKNSIFFKGPDLAEKKDKQPTPYFKSDLLVFGEFMPFGQTFPILYKWLPFVGVYEKGPGPVLKTITTPEVKEFNLGPQICYESLNSKFSRGLASAGADIIFNATNDSWYGPDTEPYQHMIMTLARAVEVRRPLIRSTNTGISTALLADGTQLSQSPMDQAWVHTFQIKYKKNAEQSFYTKYGHFDYMFWFLFLLIILFSKGTNHVRHQKS